MREVEKYIPKLYKSLMDIYQNVDTEKETDVIREEYAIIDGISIDFGIMQRTRKAFVIRCDFIWDDIGSFASLSRFLGNCRGNSISGETYMKQSEGCSVFGGKRLIIGFGLKDIIIVDAGDVLLVMDKNKDQEIKHLFNELKDSGNLEKYI